jgi:hypothetical protein
MLTQVYSTHCIADLEAGKIPEWTDKPAPEIAIDYWFVTQPPSSSTVLNSPKGDFLLTLNYWM